jgi:hypothetical protein
LKASVIRKFAYLSHFVTGKPLSPLQPMSQSLALLQAAADSVNNTRAEVILVKSIAQKKRLEIWKCRNSSPYNPQLSGEEGQEETLKTPANCVFFPNFFYK